MEEIMPMLLALAAKYPMASSVFMAMGVLRAVFKPLFALVLAYVNSTPSQSDNAFLDKVMGSKAYKYVGLALDYFASVKLPQK